MPLAPPTPPRLGNPPKPGGLGERILDGIKWVAGEILNALLEPLAWLGARAAELSSVTLFTLLQPSWEQMVNRILNDPDVPEELKIIARDLLQAKDLFSLMLTLPLFILNVGSVYTAIKRPFLAKAGYEVAKRNPYFRISAEDGLLAERRGALDFATILSDLADEAVDPQRAQALIAQSYRWLTSTQIEEMFYRGIIDQGRAQQLLKGLGLPDEQVAEHIQTFTRLVSASDLQRFGIREVFTPELAEALKTPTPGDRYYEEMALIGFSRERAEWYWMAHWRLIGEGRSQDIVRRVGRGGTIEGQDTKDWYLELLRRNDVLSKYWEPMWDTRFRAVSRIDVWRLAQAGKIDRDTAYNWYQDYGYSPEISATLADAGAKSSTLGGRELTRADIENAYKERRLDRNAAVAALIDLGYEEDEIEMILARGDFTVARSTAQRRSTVARQRYLAGQIDSGAAQVALAEAGYTAPEIDDLLALWTEEREARVERPSVSQLLGFYRSRTITGPQLEAEIRGHGYSDQYVSWYIGDVEADIADAAARQSATAKRAAARRIKLPTKADLLDWLQAGIITLDQFRDAMLAQRYLPEDIDRYLKEAGIVPVVPAYRTEEGKVRLATLKLQYRGGFIPEADLRTGLLALEMPPSLADAIIEYELVKATPPTP